MKVAYYQTANGFAAVTSEAPKGMDGVLLLGKGPEPGKGIESVKELFFTRELLLKMMPVKKEEVPDIWLKAFDYEKAEAKDTGRRQRIIIFSIILILSILWILIFG